MIRRLRNGSGRSGSFASRAAGGKLYGGEVLRRGAAEHILKVFVEAKQKKVEKIIREASRDKEEKCT